MTIEELVNPFEVTKAAEFSDRQIADYWVDLPGGAGFRELAKPKSPMPMLILGGKGSGKTHLMRYFSYPLQKIRHENLLEGIRSDGYIGIYLRCSGLNAARFSGKGQLQEKWDAVFAFSMDLWLAQLVLTTIWDVFGSQLPAKTDALVASKLSKLFDDDAGSQWTSIREILETLQTWQREIDAAVNNAAITRQLTVTIRSSPGRLIFGIPKALSASLPALKKIQFLYLIDELENLRESHQRYLNTLVREREDPCSFKLGARLYGIRTFETLSAGEVNKEGSEYEKLSLDDRLRQNPNYRHFARNLIVRRLSETGYLGAEPRKRNQLEAQLDGLFESLRKGPFAQGETRFIVDKYEGKERPYFEKLSAKLAQAVRLGKATGISDQSEIAPVINRLRAPEYPLIEKANLHAFYKTWALKRDLRKAALQIEADAKSSIAEGKPAGCLKTTLSHFQGDLLAQLYSDAEQRPLYIGIDTFVEMSRGLPRNLLVILKHVVQWAVFNGERPFRGEPISRRSQQRGVTEAAQWFLRDAEVLGEDALYVQNSIEQLADLFRGVRYSDKPAECSLSTFSANLGSANERSREILRLAENWSLLIRVQRGQKERNTRRVDAKYQLNSMLAPIWDLPIARRGALSLTPEEVNAIFDPAHHAEFNQLKRRRVGRMTAPTFDAVQHEDSNLLPLFASHE